MKLLFDSDVSMRVLNGSATPKARYLLPGRSVQEISIIAWLEGMSGAREEAAEQTGRFLMRFEVVDITKNVADETVRLRKAMRLKLPDAIIYATAFVTGRTLVTYNSRDYPEGARSVMIPL